MSLLFGIFLLCGSIHAGITCDDYFSVKRNCSSCHLNAYCLRAASYKWCVCVDGYTGDGLRCTPTSDCSDSSCCPPTYIWDQAHHCCSSTNFCSSPGLNRCDPKEKCVPTHDHYLCEGEVRSNSTLSGCNGQTCSAGQDCKRFLDGGVRCVDPCLDHEELDNSWRADNYTAGADFQDDRHLHGWFHFVGLAGSRMAEQCMASFLCGAGSPVSLQGPHPSLADGIVLRHGVHTDKCVTTTQIYVKACPGNFFVYKLMGLYYPGFSYCMDHTSVPVPACSPACAQDEECLWVDHSWGCYCKPNVPAAPGTSELDVAVACGATSFTVTLSRCQLERMDFVSSSMSLEDPTCVGQRGYGAFSTIAITSGFRQCGTSLEKLNNRYAQFSNMIHLTSASGSPDNNREIHVSCDQPLDMQLSLELFREEVQSALSVPVPGLGNLTLKVALFKDPFFTEPFEQQDLAVPRGLPVYVGVYIQDGAHWSNAMVVVKNCYETPSSDPGDPNRHFYVIDRCPSPADPSVRQANLDQLYEAGFAASMFTEPRGHDSMYLHCAVQACSFPLTDDCHVVCPPPVAMGDLTNLLTIGPIRRAGVSHLVPSVTCDVDGIVVSVSQSVVEGLGYDTIVLPVTQDSHCVGSPESSTPDTVSIRTPFLNRECGLQFTVNNSQVTIFSSLRLAVRENGELWNLSIGIPFSCSFRLIKPGISTIQVASGGNRSTAEISVYTDSAYTLLDPHLGAADFVPGNRLDVKVQLISPSDPLIALVVHSCYAEVTFQENVTVIQLIKDGTPVQERLNTAVTENGNSSQARFSFEVSDSLHLAEEFSLHCEVFICVKSSTNCLPRRVRRSAQQQDGVQPWVVSRGPFKRTYP